MRVLHDLPCPACVDEDSFAFDFRTTATIPTRPYNMKRLIQMLSVRALIEAIRT
jgi:hypothetical protein